MSYNLTDRQTDRQTDRYRLLVLILLAIVGIFLFAVQAHAANDSTKSTREKYGLLINDYPKVEKVGYQFEGWYTSATGGTKIDPAKWTTPNAARTDYYAHWKPNTYKLTVNFSNYRNKSQTGNNGSDVNAINNVTITATRKGSSPADTRTYTLANGGTCYLKFDDEVTITANMNGSYTQGDWFYGSSTNRYKARHNMSFGGWKITPASNSPAKPVIANTSAVTTSFKWLCTDGIVLSCSGTDTTSRTDIQNLTVRSGPFYIVDDHNLSNQRTATLSVGSQDNWNDNATGNWVTTGFKVEQNGNYITITDHYAYRGSGHPYGGFKVTDNSTGESWSVSGTSGRTLTIDAKVWK